MDEYLIRNTQEVVDFTGLLLALSSQYYIPLDVTDARLNEIGVDRIRYFQPQYTKYQYIERNGYEWIKTADAIPEVPAVEDDPETPEDESQPAIPAVPEQGYYQMKWNIIDMTEEQKAPVRLQYQSQVWAEIRAERDRRLGDVGIPLTIGGVEKGLETDVLNRTRYLKMAMTAAQLKASGGLDTDAYVVDSTQVMWKTMDNSFVPMTLGLAIQIADAVELQEAQVFAQGEAHKTAMLLLDDPTTYDYSTGWPAQYIVPVLDPPEALFAGNS